MSVKHSVFVLDKDGKPLTPCTPCKARKLLQGGKAKKVWSKFNTFGIQLLEDSRKETPVTVLGHDVGTKFEGFSVVCDSENPLNVQLNLPNKSQVVRKMDQRRWLRRNRRSRLRKREARFNNRKRLDSWLAPSQRMIVQSRVKCANALMQIYPISHVAIEDVKFNHAKKRWGSNFSTCEVGKETLYRWYRDQGCVLLKYEGWETKQLREKYGYKKSSDKATGGFSSHCSDSLALACEVGPGLKLSFGQFLTVDGTYIPVRRQILRGVRGTVKGLRKGLKIATKQSKIGRLNGFRHGAFGYINYLSGIPSEVVNLSWVSTQYLCK